MKASLLLILYFFPLGQHTSSQGVVSPGSTAIGITVAGGHGAGSAANQLGNAISVFVDPTGNMYVSDPLINFLTLF